MGFANHPSPRPLFAFLLAFTCLAVPAGAQGTKEDYERALSLRERVENQVFRDRVEPNWLPDGKRFWYRVRTGPDTREMIMVDAETGERKPAFDHAALAAALGPDMPPDRLPLESAEISGDGTELKFRHRGKAFVWTIPGGPLRESGGEKPATLLSSERPLRLRPSRRTGERTEITFLNRLTEGEIELFWLDSSGERRSYGKVANGGERVLSTYAGHVWLVADAEGRPLGVFEAEERAITAEIDGPGRPAREGGERRGRGAREERRGVVSPDGAWRVETAGHHLKLVPTAPGGVEILIADGTEEEPYSGQVEWSPDSSRFIAVRVKPGRKHEVAMVESSPRDQLRPKLKTISYLKPGDTLPRPRPVLFVLKDHRVIPVDTALCDHPFTEDGRMDLRWLADGSECVFSYNQRGHQVYRLLAIHGETGAVRVVVEEKSDTFIDWTRKTWREWLEETGELLWMSERDGWCHLYLYDLKTGRVKNQVTRGEWVTRRVERVDRAERRIWFYASGLREGEDPYHEHLCRVNFDGSGFVRLTEGDGGRRVRFSPDGKYFLDEWSRADHPPVTELRRSEDGGLVCELERADWSALLAAGWTAPERFTAKGRDGKTDIHGVIIKPSNFDPAKRYPVLEEVYAGPHDSFAPKRFGLLPRQHALAELGFIVVQADGMGTNNRGKKFHDVAWKNLADAGFPDRIAWIKAAAETRPWMDLDRVGIYGGSAGGQNAARALLDHGDFYKAAAADCGCHDNRMDKIWWNEQWLGWPVDESYVRSSNVEDAAKLRGRLLLTVGELDTNVDPASTMQFVDALVRANKDFELLVLPGMNHGAGESPYGVRKRMDFFVRHLLKVEPPALD